jgi:hypothetical protein
MVVVLALRDLENIKDDFYKTSYFYGKKFVNVLAQ